MRRSRSIFQKMFTGTIFLIILTLLLYYGFLFFYEYRKNMKQSVNESVELSDKINRALEDYIIQVDGTISSIYYELYLNETGALSTLLKDGRTLNTEEKLHQRDALNKYFSQLFLMRRDFVDVSIFVDEEKNFIYSTFGGRILDYSYQDSIWFQKTLEKNGKTNITMNYIPGQITYKKPVIGFSRVLKNVSNEGIKENTIVLLDFTMKNLDNLFENYITNDMTTVMLVDRQGDIVYQYGAPLSFQDNSLKLNYPEGKEVHFQRINGQKYMIAGDGKEVYEWKVIIAVNTAYIMNQMKDYLMITVCIGVVLIILAAAVTYMFARNLYKPVKSLEQGMQVIQSGEFHIRLQKKSNDELGRLIDDFNRMAEEIQKLIREKYEEELQKKDAQYKFLQAQIDPHFIFNTLQIISSMALVKQTPEIEIMSNSLARLIRSSICGEQKTILLKEELKNVRSYLEIQKIRFRDRLSYSITVGEGLENVRMIKLILQPIVENSISHGLERTGEKGHVEINAYKIEDKVLIELSDDGKGMAEKELSDLMAHINRPPKDREVSAARKKKELEAREKGNHVGLRNINMRLKMYYGEDYGLQMVSSPAEGTKVTICIPYMEKEE